MHRGTSKSGLENKLNVNVWKDKFKKNERKTTKKVDFDHSLYLKFVHHLIVDLKSLTLVIFLT